MGVVTLALPAIQQLLFGQVYSYNVTFTGVGTQDLKSNGLLAEGTLEGRPHLPLGYEPNTLPSFVVPPSSLDDLRLYHASCRKPHGQDPDTLGLLDEEIALARADPIHRPHQLFLTGDQIYADEVPIALLAHLSAAGRQLIGTQERLPLDAGEIVVNEETLPGGLRHLLTRNDIGFSSSAADSHLISLGEYCATYLFGFSNVLWPDMTTMVDDIPRSLVRIEHSIEVDPDHLRSEDPEEDLSSSIFTEPTSGGLTFFFNELSAAERHLIESDEFKDEGKKRVMELALSGEDAPEELEFLVDQARILANMHHPEEERRRTIEVFLKYVAIRAKSWTQVRPPDPADEFIRSTVIAFYEALPKVRRALANVATYMIFDDHDVTDDWYLNREWRARVHGKPLGRAVLRNAMVAYGIFQGWGNDPDQFGPGGPNAELLVHVPDLYAGGAVPDAAAAAALDALFGLDDAIPSAQWHYEVPGPTYRTVVLDTRTRRELPGFRDAPGLISAAALDEQLPEGPLQAGQEVLIVVSAAPVLDLPVLEEIVKPIAIRLAELFAPGEADGAAKFDLESWSANPAGFEILLARLASYERVLVLSGDVHFGSSAHLSYWRKDVDEPARVVQFTSSAAKNIVPEARQILLLARSTFAQRVQRLDVPLERLAWADASSDPVQLSATHSTPPALRARLNRSPVLIPTFGWPEGTSLAEPVEWSWRLELLADSRPDIERPEAVHPLPLDGPVTAENAFEGYRRVARRHADSLDAALFARQMVFATNIGRVSFDTAGGSLSARHDLLAVHPEDPLSKLAPYTRHEASLAPITDEPPTLRTGDQ